MAIILKINPNFYTEGFVKIIDFIVLQHELTNHQEPLNSCLMIVRGFPAVRIQDPTRNRRYDLYARGECLTLRLPNCRPMVHMSKFIPCVILCDHHPSPLVISVSPTIS